MSEECSQCNILRTQLLCDLLEESAELLASLERGVQPKKGHIDGLVAMINTVVPRARQEVLGIPPQTAQ